jgi:hypothetical protein
MGKANSKEATASSAGSTVHQSLSPPPSKRAAAKSDADRNDTHKSVDMAQLIELSQDVPTDFKDKVMSAASSNFLDLENYRLAAFPGELFAFCPSISTLNLSKNKLVAVPPELSMLSCLTVLRLSGNQLTSFPPDVVSALTNLTILDLSRNRLDRLPAGMLASRGSSATRIQSLSQVLSIFASWPASK